MTLRHAFVSLVAVLALAACSDDDTIVSLNVTATDAVPVIDTLRVTVTQGTHKFVTDFAPPVETPTAPEGQDAPPPSIKNSFFHRITLSGEWSEKEATVGVEALHANGTPYSPTFAAQTLAVIQPEGVVAAYVKLDVPTSPPPPPPPGDGGAGGTGGEGGGGSGDAGAGAGGASNGGAGGTGNPSAGAGG